MPYLVVENGNRRGLRVEVPEGGKVVLGRDSHADIAVSDHLCSRAHFEVECVGGVCTLRDLGSSNGTYLNDARSLEAGVLRHGDCLQAGETQLTFLEETGQGARGLVGKTVGGYRILERIGRGGMGTVYKANQTSLNRTVALKVLSPKFAQDPVFVAKFHKEAQAAGQLNHPNIVQVYDVGSDGGLHYFSMEYIENGSVQDLATREGTVDTDLSLAIIIDAARGLEYAEKRGLVHRDIKPDNLMVIAEGVVKIADLGLARDAGRAAKEAGAHEGEHHEDDEGIFGTPHFISPEQALGRAVDTRSDIYSLGASFYRLVTGETPFQGDSIREIVQKQINEEPVAVREKNREVPPAVAQIIERMMLKDPDDRFGSATELLDSLERVSTRAGRGSRTPLLLAAALAVVAAVGGAVWFANRDVERDPNPEPRPGPIVPPDVDRPTPPGGTSEVQIQALRKLQDLRLADAKLIGAQRTVETVGDLQGRFREFIAEHEGGTAAKEADDARPDVERLEGELAALVEARQLAEQAARARAAAAEASFQKAMDAANRAIADREFVVAAQTLIAAQGDEDLSDVERYQIELRQKMESLQETARAAVAEATNASGGLLAAGNFADARRGLKELADKLRVETSDDGRLAPFLELSQSLDQEVEEIRASEAAKAAADAAHDQRVGFEARKRAFAVLGRSFDPQQATALIELAIQDLRTDAWRMLLRRDVETIGALVRVRNGFLERLRKEPINPGKDIVPLPSAAENKPDVRWDLTEVTATGFAVERGGGTFKQTHPFKDYAPAELLRRLFSLRPDRSDAGAADELILLTVSGEAAEAARRAEELTLDPDIESWIQQEAEAVDLVARIRDLQKKAATDKMEFLRILPLLEQMFEDYRHTIPFLTHSNGTTPLVEQ
jgi:pSer/pThr/pTyr-binding forkhead associated (FHA) protein